MKCRRTRFDPWVRNISWRRECQPTAGFLPGEFHEQRSQAGYSPWDERESATLRLYTFTFKSSELPVLRILSSTCNAGDLSWIPGSGRTLGEGNGYPQQYSFLKNFMEFWRAAVHGVAKIQTQD